jgi:hypothetical protein
MTDATESELAPTLDAIMGISTRNFPVTRPSMWSFLVSFHSGVVQLLNGNVCSLSFEYLYRQQYMLCIGKSGAILADYIARVLAYAAVNVRNHATFADFCVMLQDLCLFWRKTWARTHRAERQKMCWGGESEAFIRRAARAMRLMVIADRLFESRTRHAFQLWFFRFARLAYKPGGAGRKRDRAAYEADVTDVADVASASYVCV